MDQKSNDTPLLPGPEEILQTITSRYQEFSQTGALSGILLLIAAGIAVASSQSSIETSYTSSGGIAGTLFGRIAVVVAVTLVFGLIAIYVFEWLAQVRAGSPAADS